MNRSVLGAIVLSFVTAACGSTAVSARKPPPPSKAVAADVALIVSKMSRDLAVCYDRGQRPSPRLAASFVAELRIGPTGAVESVDAQDVSGLNHAAIACMTRHLHSARFPAPGEDGATLRIPLRFDSSDA